MPHRIHLLTPPHEEQKRCSCRSLDLFFLEWRVLHSRRSIDATDNPSRASHRKHRPSCESSSSSQEGRCHREPTSPQYSTERKAIDTPAGGYLTWFFLIAGCSTPAGVSMPQRILFHSFRSYPRHSCGRLECFLLIGGSSPAGVSRPQRIHLVQPPNRKSRHFRGSRENWKLESCLEESRGSVECHGESVDGPMAEGHFRGSQVSVFFSDSHGSIGVAEIPSLL